MIFIKSKVFIFIFVSILLILGFNTAVKVNAETANSAEQVLYEVTSIDESGEEVTEQVWETPEENGVTCFEDSNTCSISVFNTSN